MVNRRVFPAGLNENMIRLALYTETTYMLVSSIFDISAKVNRQIYPKWQSNIPCGTFTPQLDWFVNNKIDLELTAFLGSIKQLYSQFKQERDDMTHYIAAFISNIGTSEPLGSLRQDS